MWCLIGFVIYNLKKKINAKFITICLFNLLEAKPTSKSMEDILIDDIDT